MMKRIIVPALLALLLKETDIANAWVCSCDTQEICQKENPLTENRITGTYKPQYTAERVGDRMQHGEAPFWCEENQKLFYVDVDPMVLKSYDPETDECVTVNIVTDKDRVSTVIRVKDTKDQFIINLDDVLAVVKWDGVSTTPLLPKVIATVETTPGSVLNEAKADPAFRLWDGSKSHQTSGNPNTFLEGKGSVYLITPDGQVSKKVRGWGISNGLEWNLDHTKFFIVDSLSYKIFQFDYDNTTGAISNEKVIYDLSKHCLVTKENALPDGMTIDTEGMLWLAVYAEQRVLRINPETGELLFEIVLPKALQITSVAFGGKDLDILFVTSAKLGWSAKLESLYPESGYLYKITGLGVKGLPSRPVELDKKFWIDI